MIEPVDVVYLAWNRLTFTRASFGFLLANTRWERVRRLAVYDDGSTDGTREWLDDAVRDSPVETSLTHLGHGSPVTTMKHYLGGDPAPMFAKIDNDVAVPSGWLDAMTSVLDRHPNLELLGMEAGQTWLPFRDGRPFEGVYGFTPCRHIGGVGLMRSSAFLRRAPMAVDGRFGFTEWQHQQRPERGWITPDLLVPQLDRMPTEPWRSLSKRYVRAGWQRRWPSMDPVWGAPYYDWIGGQA